ncbi:RNA recognition motif-containing protein [Prochlorococcus marinus]|uniref:RNA recognition motif-containing protein n=1 Tax=Prochlorococcus marinus XMU1408 TaxID=2213228 RepID=A0A318R3N3_PROMR|nr:RNA recognition motif-containing protein [Prochlorococcus marinus]MBW3041684.1 RNA recognition motif-containing protein [Prochlorococcus marinus str. XMU1408]PYE02834.1 RNA recognition motif-containing protein [Prochlorococcus marinus XMU1408]
MTTTNKQIKINSTSTNDALIDQLRACKNPEEILQFEKWFNSNIESDKLYKRICELLKNRSISRGLASKWLLTLIEDRDNNIRKLSIQ